MKTKEELNAIKQEVEAVNEKLYELSDEELEQVVGGIFARRYQGCERGVIYTGRRPN